MPDHWHGLIELGDMDTLSALVGRIKGAMARSVNIATSRQGALWDTGFHDHGIHCDEDVVDIARYIVCNPLRASLVDRMGDYPFWDAVWITEGHHG